MWPYFVAVAFICLICVSPYPTARLVSRNLKKDRDVEWDWQNQLIGKAEDVLKQAVIISNDLAESQVELDEKINKVAMLVADHHSIVFAQTQKLYSFMHSDVKAARRDELTRARELKVALERIVTLTSMARMQPDSMYVEAIESVTKRIEELESILNMKGETTLG